MENHLDFFSGSDKECQYDITHTHTDTHNAVHTIELVVFGVISSDSTWTKMMIFVVNI